MTPSVTSGAMTGSAARKIHAKLARGSSKIMEFLRRSLREQRGAGILPKPLTNDRQNGANIPEGALKSACCEGCVHMPSHRRVP
jgi:hypothetical protein